MSIAYHCSDCGNKVEDLNCEKLCNVCWNKREVNANLKAYNLILDSLREKMKKK